MRESATFVGALLVALVLAACGPGDPMTGRAASDLPPGPLQPLPSEPSATDAPSCRVLSASRGATKDIGTEGESLEIVFTNDGDASCTVHGYPTLTMRDANGRNMGERAKLVTSGAARYIVLDAGESASATVRFPRARCTSGTAQIEILIPGATEREFVAEDHPYCPGWTVTAIQQSSSND